MWRHLFQWIVALHFIHDLVMLFIWPHQHPKIMERTSSESFMLYTHTHRYIRIQREIKAGVFLGLFYTFNVYIFLFLSVFLFIKAEILINHTVPGVWGLGMQNITRLILRRNKTATRNRQILGIWILDLTLWDDRVAVYTIILHS